MASPYTAASIGLAATQGSGLPHAPPRSRRYTNETDLSHSSSSGRGGDGEGAVVRKAVTTACRALSRGATNIVKGGTCISSARVGVAGSGHYSFEADGWMNGVKEEAVGSRSGRGGRRGMRLRRVAWGGSGDGSRSRRHKARSRSPRCYQAEATATSDANATMTEPRVRHGQGVEEREQGLPRADQSQVEEDVRGKVWPALKTEQEILMAHYVPVYVMLPLDAVKRENKLSHPELLGCNLRALRAAGVDGVMVDVWWGIVEAGGPKQYNWAAYKQLFTQIQAMGLKVQVVMSFHQCGGNTGDSCYIPLPPWILEAGAACPDIFFTNQDGQRNQEYLSFGVDEEPVLSGRTAVQVYYDFMKSFRENMAEFLEARVVTEIEVGLGPAGELRYPSYPETHGWRFPGIGEFQCYDKFLLADLRDAANSIGQFEWGYRGPHDAGRYNDWPSSTGFFGSHGTYSSDYGRFFLEWYSSVLLRHGDRVLEGAAEVFHGCTTKLAAKVAGIHWWYNSRNHAAELAAGYYNLRERDGYRPIAKMLSRHNATLNFTCAEMRNDEQYWEARCGPEGLVQQVLNAGWQEGLEVACENALPRYDISAFDKIVANARPDNITLQAPPKRRISAFTFLRLCPDLLQERNWNEFVRFVRAMHAGQDYHPEPEQFFRPRMNVRHSKPIQALVCDDPQVPVASIPLNVSSIPLAPEPGSQPFFSSDAPGGGLGAQVGERSSSTPFASPLSQKGVGGDGGDGGDEGDGGSRKEGGGKGRGEEGGIGVGLGRGIVSVLSAIFMWDN